MTGPPIVGIHHIKIPVGDLAIHLLWFQNVFGAQHVRTLDHVDSDGVTFASIVTIPGVALPIELRWAPVAARALRECDALILTIGNDDIAEWIEHLDAQDAEHSPVISGPGGEILVVVDPDGKYIRMMAPPPDQSTAQDLREQPLDPQGPWLNPVPMQHPPATADRDQSTVRPAS